MSSIWFDRASAAGRSVLDRHERRVLGLPATRLGVPGWPAKSWERSYIRWMYWWQAHLIDCCIDAALRDPSALSRRRVHTMIRSVKLRNFGRITNRYNDDIAWMGLAMQRADRELFIRKFSGASFGDLKVLENRFLSQWEPDLGGGIPWHTTDKFFNAPANGPAGIFLARMGDFARAQEMADWMWGELRDDDSGLIIDGFDVDTKVDGKRVRSYHDQIYSYCQGVTLGLLLELALIHPDVSVRQRNEERLAELLYAVNANYVEREVIPGAGGGDGGLFAGILARYLAQVATRFPEDAVSSADVRSVASSIVLSSAEAAWNSSVDIGGGLLFSEDWATIAKIPARSGSRAHERDLSVQLSGWMVFEAAYTVSG